MLRYLLLLASVPLLAAELSILPGSVTLSGPESYQQLIAEANHRQSSGRSDRRRKMDFV